MTGGRGLCGTCVRACVCCSYKMTGGKGTLRYMAPEVVLNQDYNDSVDIYSFGLVIWYMCTGQ